MYAHTGATSYWPFDSLVRTLNLLKTSDGPVVPIQYYHAAPETRMGNAEVEQVFYGELVTSGDQYGNEWPFLQGYELGPRDHAEYLDLKPKLDAALATDTAGVELPTAHIWNESFC